jgi:hypothetical protein
MTSAPLTVQARAYLKALLHVAKYPHETVVGLLVGHGTDVEDVYPLLHHWVDLSFAAEAGLRIVSSFHSNFLCFQAIAHTPSYRRHSMSRPCPRRESC